MSLPHALLTALLERPSSGSELANRFDRSIGYFWSATHQQIYRELGRLEEAGLVQARPAESARGRKRVYRVLAAGRRELRRWLSDGLAPKPVREELLVRLRAEAVIGPTALSRELEALRAQHVERLALFQSIEARDFPAPDSSQKAAVQHVVLQAGIIFETAWIEFCTKALKALA
jgi:DNA-binding PadR family transcriptional regulator